MNATRLLSLLQVVSLVPACLFVWTASAEPGNEPAAPFTIEQSGGDPAWGQIRGRLVLDGLPPATKWLTTREGKVILDESLLVDPRSHGVANIAIWLVADLKPAMEIPIHESYRAALKRPVIVNLLDHAYSSRIVPVVAGQEVTFRNASAAPDNVLLGMQLNPAFNRLIAAKDEITTRFDKAERLPLSMNSNIQPVKTGRILVQSHPYMAVSDGDGRFTFENLPPGAWTFCVWHERLGYVRQVRREGELQELKRGRLDMVVSPGQNEWGEFRLPAELFGK